ncbi:MAG: transporter [Burkholderiales bacterium]|nr:transporter [Burkholderiales bacterium]
MKPTKRKAFLILLLVLTGSSNAVFAFQPLVTDDTGTQGDGRKQLEAAFTLDRAASAGNTVRTQTLPLVYTAGVAEALDVFAGWNHARIRSNDSGGDASGGANPAFGIKWRFYENQAGKTSIALKPEVLFPVSAGRESAGLGRGKTSGNLTLVLTREVSFGAIHINAGAGRDRYRDTSSNPDTTRTRASIAPVLNLTQQWKLALDMGTESAHAGGARVRTDFVELGAIYSPGKDLDVALGIIRSSDNDTPLTTTHAATVGIAWRFD